MGKNQLKADDVSGFVLAFTDEIKDTEMMYGVTCYVRVVLTGKRGELKLVGVATRLSDVDKLVEVGRAERQWPSARYTSLHGLLYALAMSLNVEVQKEHRERTGRFYSSPTPNGSE